MISSVAQSLAVGIDAFLDHDDGCSHVSASHDVVRTHFPYAFSLIAIITLILAGITLIYFGALPMGLYAYRCSSL